MLSKQHGFEFVTYPVPPKTMQDQRSTWEKIEDDEPDWLFMWGWGAMNPTAVKGAVDIDYPMDRFMGVWWSGNESDVRDPGAKATGYLAGEMQGLGTGWPLFDDLKKHVIGKSGSQTPESMVGETLYNRGIWNAVIVAEAIRTRRASSATRRSAARRCAGVSRTSTLPRSASASSAWPASPTRSRSPARITRAITPCT